jgi:hypothetical protein
MTKRQTSYAIDPAKHQSRSDKDVGELDKKVARQVRIIRPFNSPVMALAGSAKQSRTLALPCEVSLGIAFVRFTNNVKQSQRSEGLPCEAMQSIM